LKGKKELTVETKEVNIRISNCGECPFINKMFDDYICLNTGNCLDKPLGKTGDSFENKPFPEWCILPDMLPSIKEKMGL
jgi:hypothetical protein